MRQTRSRWFLKVGGKNIYNARHADDTRGNVTEEMRKDE